MRSTTAHVPLPKDVRTFFTVSIAATLCSILFGICAYALRLGRGYVTQLSSRVERFGDYPIYIQKFHYFHSSAFFTTDFPFTYPAPVSLIYYFFYNFFGSYGEQAFLAFCVLAYVFIGIGFGRALVRRGISTTTACTVVLILLATSWPALLVVDRGNMEIAVFVVLVLAFWAYASGRLYVAAVLFGLGASLKLFPFVFLALFLSRRQYRQLFAGIISFFCFSLVSLEILGPTIPIAYRGISNGLAFFKAAYMQRWNPTENGVDHSMFAFAKAALIVMHGNFGNQFQKPLSIYLALTVIGGTALYFLRIWKLPVINQILLLTIASIYFTPFSGDGTLLHLYTPFAMLVFVSLKAQNESMVVVALRPAMICFGLLLAAESFIVYRHAQHLEGEFKCVVLGYLFVLALRHPFGPPLTLDPLDQELSFDPPLPRRVLL